jgi:hypothetical protein
MFLVKVNENIDNNKLISEFTILGLIFLSNYINLFKFSNDYNNNIIIICFI